LLTQGVVSNDDMETQLVGITMQSVTEDALSWGCRVEWYDDVVVDKGEVDLMVNDTSHLVEARHLENDVQCGEANTMEEVYPPF